ncbi:MAG: hypothetical protein ACREP8_10785, partial [Candidatus Binatia bacterium]
MTNEERLLKGKFAALLNWERAKSREKVLVSAFFYSLAGSLLLLPAVALVAPFEVSVEVEPWLSPLSTAPILFLIFALSDYRVRPWGKTERLRSILRLDRAL